MLVIAAVWCGIRQDFQSFEADDEGFVELEGYDSPSPLSHETAQPAPLSLPPSPNESPFEGSLDLGPVLAEAGVVPSPALTAVHTMTARESAPASPVWLTGTIETEDDSPQPLPDSTLRFSHAFGRDEPSQR